MIFKESGVVLPVAFEGGSFLFYTKIRFSTGGSDWERGRSWLESIL